MTNRIDLVWLGTREMPEWPLGAALRAEASAAAINRLLESRLPRSQAEAWLFWDGDLGSPDPERILRVLELPGDLWHAGLSLGSRGLPALLDFVAPVWMLNRDADSGIDSSSWRVSLRACLVKSSALRWIGALDGGFETLSGASLEMGHRAIKRGVLARHAPGLLPDGAVPGDAKPCPADEIRFLSLRAGRFWTLWALFRALSAGVIRWTDALRGLRSAAVTRRAAEGAPYLPDRPLPSDSEALALPVSVVLPTLDRYDYLRRVLRDIGRLTIRPLEIIVVDQTPASRRISNLAEEFKELPLTIIQQERPGQCSARNAALELARGQAILFLDDDIEFGPGLLEDHLRTLARSAADASSGVLDEPGTGALPEDFRCFRTSDVFPGCNTLVRRSALEKSGLFDLAYDTGQRADGDLGQRVYLSGALMVYDPRISVLHHRAPRGGLRAHGARVTTYAGSRKRILERQLVSATELYLAKRYFSRRQVREMRWLRAAGTFSCRRGLAMRLLKVLLGLAYLPHTLWSLSRRDLDSDRMLAAPLRIPALPRQWASPTS